MVLLTIPLTLPADTSLKGCAHAAEGRGPSRFPGDFPGAEGRKESVAEESFNLPCVWPLRM
jgi:hypothetical protein